VLGFFLFKSNASESCWDELRCVVKTTTEEDEEMEQQHQQQEAYHHELSETFPSNKIGCGFLIYPPSQILTTFVLT